HQMMLNIAHRRLVDADEPTSKPFAAACYCSEVAFRRLLRNDGSSDLEEVIRWIPALSLIDWSYHHREFGQRSESLVESDGTFLLQALARPLFHGRKLE